MAALDEALDGTITPSYTLQGEIDCAYHVSSQLMVHNMVEFAIPFKIPSTYIENNCNRFLDTNNNKLKDLKVEECTPDGYLKIILFHYFYSLYVWTPVFGEETFTSLSVGDMLNIYPSVVKNYIPPNTLHEKDITDTMSIVNHVTNELGISWKTVAILIKENMFEVIKRVVGLGFYVALQLIDETSTKHSKHSVHIVGIKGTKIQFKNSWGVHIIYEMEIDETITLNPFNYTVDNCVLLLPYRGNPMHLDVYTPEQMEEFCGWLDEYELEITEMKKRIPGILAKYISHFKKDADTFTVGPILKRIAGTHKGAAETYKEPTETHKGAESTFNVGDKVATGSIRGQIETIVEDGFMVTYKEGTRTKTKKFSADQLTNVGGTRRRRKSRKRIR